MPQRSNISSSTTVLPFFPQDPEVVVSLLCFKTNPSSVLFFWNLLIQLFTLCHKYSMCHLLPYLQFFSLCWVIFYKLKASSFFPILQMFFAVHCPLLLHLPHFATQLSFLGLWRFAVQSFLLWTFTYQLPPASAWKSYSSVRLKHWQIDMAHSHQSDTPIQDTGPNENCTH